MSRAQLERSLTALRVELDGLGPEADELRPRLGVLIKEIEEELDGLEAPGVLERIGHRIEAFEVEHPRVTNILNDIMVTLSNLGI